MRFNYDVEFLHYLVYTKSCELVTLDYFYNNKLQSLTLDDIHLFVWNGYHDDDQMMIIIIRNDQDHYRVIVFITDDQDHYDDCFHYR